MKVAVIGKGGREHAILNSLKKSKKISELFCIPGNGGTAKIATNVAISEMDNSKIVEYVKKEKINFVVVAPDNPLANGLVDDLEKIGVSCFGPNKKAAQIESSKVFAKNLMKKYNIPTAEYLVFNDKEKAIKYLKEQKKYPIVIKADGLFYGKGVVVAKDFEMAKEAVEKIMEHKTLKESGRQIVIEEFLTGTEVSVLTLTDGKTVKPLISALDHKRAFENNKGPNTGGMGAIAPNPAYTKKIAKICEKEIFNPTIKAMQKENAMFKGCLYFGLMLTEKGPKVIEYNCRFGDPETQAVLPLLKTDLFSLMEATNKQNLNSFNLEFSDEFSACVVLASKGYPEKFETGFNIEFNNKPDDKTFIFHSGTILKNNKFLTNSGRVISICCLGNSLKNAIEKAYSTAELINFENIFYRKDIGKNALI